MGRETPNGQEVLARFLAERMSGSGFEALTLAALQPDARPAVTAERVGGEIRFAGLLPGEDRLRADLPALLLRLVSAGLVSASVRDSSGTTCVELARGRLRFRREEGHLSSPQPPVHGEAGPIRLPEAHKLLHAIGIATKDGRIRADRARKYSQVNRFVDLLAEYIQRIGVRKHIEVLDAGCGQSYLTFALSYFIRELQGRNCHIVGIDSNPERIRDAEAIRHSLGYENMEFHAVPIRQYRPPGNLDLLLSLHACDTATDEALALGVNSNAKLVFLVPCCQHELLSQMGDGPLRSITRHPLYRARMADLLTDALRTCALEAAGYEVSAVEYVSPIDTPKNLMIRAERTGGRNPAALARYRELADMFAVRPSLERMLPWLRQARKPNR